MSPPLQKYRRKSPSTLHGATPSHAAEPLLLPWEDHPLQGGACVYVVHPSFLPGTGRKLVVRTESLLPQHYASVGKSQTMKWACNPVFTVAQGHPAGVQCLCFQMKMFIQLRSYSQVSQGSRKQVEKMEWVYLKPGGLQSRFQGVTASEHLKGGYLLQPEPQSYLPPTHSSHAWPLAVTTLPTHWDATVESLPSCFFLSPPGPSEQSLPGWRPCAPRRSCCCQSS